MAQKRNPTDALFRAAQSAERGFHRRKAGELRQNARTAQQRKEWVLSESLWRQSLEADPGDRGAIIGLANALVYIGKLEEARVLAEQLAQKWPDDENAPLLLARLAEETGDTDTAVAQWRRVLVLAPAKTQALIRLGRLLTARADFAEAEACAARLMALMPDNPSGNTLRAEIAAAEGDVARSCALRRELAERFPANAMLLRDYGRALLAARDFDTCAALIPRLKALDREPGLWLEGQHLADTRPETGHTAFWREAHAAFANNTDFIRKYLHAALRDSCRDDAQRAMRALLTHPPLRAGDANFAVGLINLLEACGAEGDVRKLLRATLRALRPTASYRPAAIRLSRAIFQHFPHAPRRAPRPPTQRLLGMLRDTPANPVAKGFVTAAAGRQRELERATATCLFDTDIGEDECRGFLADVRARLAARTPYSLIRVNDGEANAVPYEKALGAFADADADEREIVWWGRTLAAADRAALNARVLAAMRDADALGIPTLARVLRDIRLDRPDDFSQTRVSRGLRAVLRAMDEGGALRGGAAACLTSALIQYDLDKWKLYGPLFDGLDDVVAVSCHAGLPEAFAALFGGRIAHHILVPPRHASLAAFGMSGMGPKILPEVLDDTIAALGGELSGRLVIVGAGYAGKCIVQAAKARGAVALDLGSMLDYWVGAATRSYQTAVLRG